MKSRRFVVVLVVALVLNTSSALAGQLASDLGIYMQKTTTALESEAIEGARAYLRSCLLAAENLRGLEAGQPGTSAAFSKVVEGRFAADALLTSETSGAPGVRAETKAYNTLLEPYLGDEYIGLVTLQDRLLVRKYFETETSKNANYLEGLLNSRWDLTRTDREDTRRALASSHLGVSPWEAILRLEPALAFHDGTRPAILGAAGLSYTFLPEVEREGEPRFKETFWSEWVKKSGGRLCLGVAQVDDKPRLLLGTGVQVRAVGIWALYEPDDPTWMLGISMTDLSVLKKVIPWFE